VRRYNEWTVGGESACQPWRYTDVMADDDVIVRLSHDQALVLSQWLYEMMFEGDGRGRLDPLIEDRTVWSSLWKIAGTLDATLPDIFAADYAERLDAARSGLGEELGEYIMPQEW
jgi:hypothetical protein